MNELEFRKRLYTNPDDPGQDILDAAATDPALRAILESTAKMERDVHGVLTGLVVPAGLAERLRAIPDTDAGPGMLPPSRLSTRVFQYYAMAACLVLAVGLLFDFNRDSTPAAGELVMGQDVLRHLYHEEAQINAIAAGSLGDTFAMPAVNRVMANAGTSLGAASFLDDMPVRYANPCLVLPGHQAAHLILQTVDGPLNVIVINNTPVEREFTIRDERFHGRVIPMERGNLVLVGEADADVEDYRELFTDSVEWVI